MMPQYFEMTCPSHPDNVGLCRVSVATFAAGLGFTLAEIEEIKVAVSEAVSNVVVHAYGKDEQGPLRLRCDETEDGMRIRVEDEGVGIADVDKAREPSFSTDPERMGLGFVFMESFSDEFQVTSSLGAGTRVEMLRRREAGTDGS